MVINSPAQIRGFEYSSLCLVGVNTFGFMWDKADKQMGELYIFTFTAICFHMSHPHSRFLSFDPE